MAQKRSNSAGQMIVVNGKFSSLTCGRLCADGTAAILRGHHRVVIARLKAVLGSQPPVFSGNPALTFALPFLSRFCSVAIGIVAGVSSQAFAVVLRIPTCVCPTLRRLTAFTRMLICSFPLGYRRRSFAVTRSHAFSACRPPSIRQFRVSIILRQGLSIRALATRFFGYSFVSQDMNLTDRFVFWSGSLAAQTACGPFSL